MAKLICVVILLMLFGSLETKLEASIVRKQDVTDDAAADTAEVHGCHIIIAGGSTAALGAAVAAARIGLENEYNVCLTEPTDWLDGQLTSAGGVDNLLVAGKTTTQTFFGSSATRLHPTDFFTGEAVGTAAILVMRNGYSSKDMYNHVDELQTELRRFMPIYWDEPRSYTPPSTTISTPTSTQDSTPATIPGSAIIG